MKTTSKIFVALLLLAFPLFARAEPSTPDAVQLATWRVAASVSDADKTTLLALLKNTDASLRQSALEILLEHPPIPATAIPALREMIESDSSATVRGLAAGVLVQAGDAAQSQIQALLLSPDLRVRQTMATAVRALPQIPDALKSYVDWASPPYALNGPSLHPNSGFEAGLLGWNLSLENGAEGAWGVDENEFKDGHHSLKITKTNGVGFIRLKSVFPIVIPASEDILTWRGWFRADNAPLSSILFMRLVDENGVPAKELAASGSVQFQSQSLLRSTPKSVWDKRLFAIKPSDTERRYWMEATLYGNPCSVWLDDLDFPAAPWNFFVSDPVPSLPSSPTKKYRAPAAPIVAQVASKNNRTELITNGQAVPPILQFPFAPRYGDFAAFERAGITTQTVTLQINDSPQQVGSQSAQTPVWPSAKSKDYYFAELLQTVQRAAAKAPNSKLVLNFHVLWPRDYVDAHPGTEWKNEKGERGYGNWLYFSGFAKELPNKNMNWWPSPYLDEPMNDAADVIRAFMRQLKTKPFSNQVVGVFISGGHDGQFYIKDRDYSPAGAAAWQNWLLQKYKSEENFNRAWKTQDQAFGSTPVPRERQAHQTPKNLSQIFFDPATETNQRDYEGFRSERMWRLKEIMLQAADEGIGRDLLGLTWQMGGALSGNLSALLQSKFLDGVVVQPSYELRMPGYVGGVPAAYNSYAAHGKLMIKEMDTRSWIRESYNNETTSMKISTPMSLDNFQKLFRKETGQMIAEDAGWWYFDISSDAFRFPGIMDEVAKEENVYRETLGKPRTFAPEVALVFSDPGNSWSRTTHYGFRKIAQWILNYQNIAFSTAGVPADKFYLDDFRALKNWDQYKTVVFVNAYYLNETERDFINRELKKNNRTLIWHYAEGYLSDENFSVTNISELTGMKIETDFSLARQRAVAIPSRDPLAKNLLPLQGMSDIFRTFFSLDTSQPTIYDAQRFWINDAQATPLARYSEDGKTAIAARRFPDWTSIYVAPLGGLSAELLNNAARESGAFVASEPNKLSVDMNDRFVSVNALQGGDFQIHLPRKAKITDVDSGKVLATNADIFNLQMEAQETRWFRLQ
jgi:hypothetical protein